MISNKVRFITWGILLLGGLACSSLADNVLQLHIPLIIATPLGLFLLGLTTYVTGVTGLWLATYGKINSLKLFGEIDKLVTAGPYSCMRHPMHLFLSLMPVEVGLIFNSFTMSFIVGPLETLAVLVMAVKLDEKESVERFGNEYLEYRESVPAFNLRPSCISKCFTKPGSRKK